MSEYDNEPVRGLPEELPEGEHIIWQGGPDWKSMALSALHIRLTIIYFAVIVAIALFKGDVLTAAAVTGLGAIAISLFTLFAWGVERTTVYTLTNKRIVLRIGVALNKCINIPLGQIESANLKSLKRSHGNIVFDLKGMPRLGYIMLWPHVRSLRVIRPRPMLRAVPEANRVAALLFDATRKVQAVAPIASQNPQKSNDIGLEGLPA
jgi:hypothetical protein